MDNHSSVPDEQTLRREMRANSYYDFLIVIVLTVLITLVGGYFDFFERWHTFVRLHEHMELDELTIGVFFFAVAMIWYSWRRRDEAQRLRRLSQYFENKARQESEAKSIFVANVSHELRTPLNTIIGYSEALVLGVFGGFKNKKHEEYVRDINASGQFLLALINDILDISKIEAQKIKLDESKIQIYSLIDNSLKNVQILAEQKHIELSKDIPEGLPHLWVDERRIVQVLINIINNAVKFTAENGKVRIKVINDNEKGVLFQITDNGRGIAPDDIARIFRPFEQGKTYMKFEEGTGLGLSLCKGMMQLHGGECFVESTPWAGHHGDSVFPPKANGYG